MCAFCCVPIGWPLFHGWGAFLAPVLPSSADEHSLYFVNLHSCPQTDRNDEDTLRDSRTARTKGLSAGLADRQKDAPILSSFILWNMSHLADSPLALSSPKAAQPHVLDPLVSQLQLLRFCAFKYFGHRV